MFLFLKQISVLDAFSSLQALMHLVQHDEDADDNDDADHDKDALW